MQEIREFFKDKKNLRTTIILGLLVLALPIALNLLSKVQVFRPKATGEFIQVTDGPCVTIKNGVKVLTCKNIPLSLTSPFGPKSSGAPIPSATPIPSASFSSSAVPSPVNSPSPTSSSSSACVTTPTSKTGAPINNQIAQYDLKFPDSTTINRVTLPAMSGISYQIADTISTSGQAVDVTIPPNSDIIFRVKTDNVCSAFSVNFKMYNNCGQEINENVGVAQGSAGWGGVCQ